MKIEIIRNEENVIEAVMIDEERYTLLEGYKGLMVLSKNEQSYLRNFYLLDTEKGEFIIKAKYFIDVFWSAEKRYCCFYFSTDKKGRLTRERYYFDMEERKIIKKWRYK